MYIHFNRQCYNCIYSSMQHFNKYSTLSTVLSVQVFVVLPVVWRIWEELDERAAAAECALSPLPSKSASMDFTVMSYNILAQDLLELNEHLYIHCPPEVLDWNYRCSLLLKEIENWTPNVSQMHFLFYVWNYIIFIMLHCQY